MNLDCVTSFKLSGTFCTSFKTFRFSLLLFLQSAHILTVPKKYHTHDDHFHMAVSYFAARDVPDVDAARSLVCAFLFRVSLCSCGIQVRAHLNTVSLSSFRTGTLKIISRSRYFVYPTERLFAARIPFQKTRLTRYCGTIFLI